VLPVFPWENVIVDRYVNIMLCRIEQFRQSLVECVTFRGRAVQNVELCWVRERELKLVDCRLSNRQPMRWDYY